MPLYDYQCSRGHEFEQFALYEERNRVRCPECGRAARIVWKVFPATDVLGCERFDPVLDVTYTSTRDRERKMAERGFEPAGDTVGGARTTLRTPDRSRLWTKRRGWQRVTPRDMENRVGTRKVQPGT